MTDQTTAPTSADIDRHNAVWTQLRADIAAFRTAHPGPDADARLAWELVTVAFARGARYGADRPNARPADAAIVAMVLGAAPPEAVALRDLVRASRRSAEAAAGVENAGACDG